MHGATILRDLVILVAVAIPVVALAQRFRIPTVVGFLLTGIAIGPHGLGFVGQTDSVSGLAEVGVVLLLFAIGLELSLSRIVKLGRSVVRGGGMQIVATVATIALLARITGVPARLGLFYGALVALSSTAIVLKLYNDRGELDTTHGRLAVAILLFQDLCVVPLMLLVPLLAGTSSGPVTAARDIAVSIAIVGVLGVGGRLLVPWALKRVVELRNREIFTLSIVFIGLAAAYITSAFGLSLALGAFLAGLIIAESEYGLQALSDVLPFRDTFSGIFFTSVGMLLDLGVVLRSAPLVLGLALGIILLKTGIVVLVVRALKRTFHVGIVTGLGLAQVGEFSFVLAGSGVALGLLSTGDYQLFLGASVLTMLTSPFAVAAAPVIADRVAGLLRRPPVVIPTQELATVRALDDHVIIVGYGLNGRNLARALQSAGVPYVILEQNGQVVRRARLDREPILFGDGTRAEVLERVGIARARVLVFAIAAPAEERRGVAVARHLSERVRIVVRTRYVAEIEELRRVGADEVVPEELETSVEIFARVLRRYGVPVNHIRRLVEEVRGDHYELFRGEEPATTRLTSTFTSLGREGGIETVTVGAGAKACGESAASLKLRSETGATVIAVMRKGLTYYTVEPEFTFDEEDEVVLVGTPEARRAAIEYFHGRREPTTLDPETVTSAEA